MPIVKSIDGRLRDLEANGELLLIGMGFLFWVIKYSKIGVVSVIHLYKYTENDYIVYFKWMNCTECEIFVNKAVIKN